MIMFNLLFLVCNLILLASLVRPSFFKLLGKNNNRPTQAELAKIDENISKPPAEYVGPVVVGVAGGSGSGKTTLAEAIINSLGKEHVTYISHDSYYKVS